MPASRDRAISPRKIGRAHAAFLGGPLRFADSVGVASLVNEMKQIAGKGELRFTPNADGTAHLHWEISFGAVAPGVAFIVAKGLERSIPAGLAKANIPT